MIGLSAGIVPSLFTRMTLPFMTFGFCGLLVLPASPIVTQSLPSGPKRMRQPSWLPAATMPRRMTYESNAVAQDLVAPLALVVARRAEVEELVVREVGVERDAHRAGLAGRVDALDGVVPELRRAGLGALEHEQVPHSLGHEHAAVRRERDIPRVAQPGLHDVGRERRLRPTAHGHREEHAFVLHPDQPVDDRPEREHVRAWRLRRFDLEGERPVLPGRD